MIEHIIEERARDLGGFIVGRVLPHAAKRMVGPFIFFDHMGPKDFPVGIPRSTDVRPHPHIGLSTVTYLFDGEIMHRDSVGSEQAIRPGAVNWMTAGRGITHSERFERARAAGGPLHGIQAWVALPQHLEEIDPSFHHYPATELPVIENTDFSARVLAGRAYGVDAGVDTRSPMFYLHCTLHTGGKVPLPDEYTDRAVYIVSGAVEIDGVRHEAGRMLVFATGKSVTLLALQLTVLMLLGGEPVGARFIDWNFVSSSKARIEQARADWQAGRMKLPDLDNHEFTPLPPASGAPTSR